MRSLALSLFLGPTMALAQVFYTSEDFYRFLENRQRMALVELQARELAKEQAEAERQAARKRERERLMEDVQDALDARTRENIEWLRAHPDW